MFNIRSSYIELTATHMQIMAFDVDESFAAGDHMKLVAGMGMLPDIPIPAGEHFRDVQNIHGEISESERITGFAFDVDSLIDGIRLYFPQ